MITRAGLTVLLPLLMMTTSVSAQVEITVFQTSAMAVSIGNRDNVTVHVLDATERWLDKLGDGVTATSSAQAVEQVSAIMETAEGQQILLAIKTAVAGLIDAWSYRLEKLPAIVINEQYVVYGVYSVDEALAIVKRVAP